MYCNEKLKKQMREQLNKHRNNSTFLKEMATNIKEQLNALMVEEMSLESLIKHQKEVLTSSLPKNVNPGSQNENRGSSTVTSDPVSDSASGYEDLDLKILSYGNLKYQDNTAQDEEEDSDDTNSNNDELVEDDKD